MTRNPTHILSFLAIASSVGFTLACVGSVEGERASLGACPRGEVCSAETPEGLVFRGQMLWDEGADRLGPILVGGDFTLSFWSPSGGLGDYDVSTDSDAIVVGPHENNEAQLKGAEEGTATVRVTDARTGELYDRVAIDAVRVADISLSNMSDESRYELYAGCEEMLGVRLLGTDGASEFRAFDDGITITASTGDVTPDVWVWDCFRYQVPEGATSIEFHIDAGEESFSKRVEVVAVDPSACPELPTD